MSDVTTDARTDDLLALVRGRFYLEHQLQRIHDLLSNYDLPEHALNYAAIEVRHEILQEFWGRWISTPVAIQTEEFLSSPGPVTSSSLAYEISDLLGIQASEFYALHAEAEAQKSASSDDKSHRFLRNKVTEAAKRAWRRLAEQMVKEELANQYRERLERLEATSQGLKAENMDLLRMMHLSTLGFAPVISVKVYAERCTGLEYDNLIRAVEELVERLGYSEKLSAQGVK